MESAVANEGGALSAEVDAMVDRVVVERRFGTSELEKDVARRDKLKYREDCCEYGWN